MLFDDLLEGVPILAKGGDLHRPVRGISNDSRALKGGDLFVCIRGFRQDGHSFIPDALRGGAAALVIEKRTDFGGLMDGVPWVQVPDARMALAIMSGRFYGWPSRDLRLIGVTGTNGKTTVAHMVHRILTMAGRPSGLVSTVGCLTRERQFYFRNTTPDSPRLNELLRNMVQEKLNYCVMEVSSHALALSRVHGLEFDVAVFTNLSRDHFEFHHDLVQYAEVKKKLFQNLNSEGMKAGPKYGVVCADDPIHRFIVDGFRRPVISFGISKDANVRGVGMRLSKFGSWFEVVWGSMRVPLRTCLPGLHNVYNSLAAIAVGVCEGIDVESAVATLEDFRGVPGRWEVFSSPLGFDVVVDFAHNPEGLRQALKTARSFYDRCITVFGCEGGKDPGKRPLMGEIAGQYSDFVILTSDNPNFEEPWDIIAQVEVGLLNANVDPTRYEKIENRSEAIKRAISMARRGDVVLVLGKGHETFELRAGNEIPHDDRKLVRELVSPNGVLR